MSGPHPVPGRHVDPRLATAAGADRLVTGVLLLRADALGDLAALASRGAHYARTHGMRLSATTTAVLNLLLTTAAEAATQPRPASPTGQRDVPDPDDQAGCQASGVSLGTVEAARLLGISARQVRRLDVVGSQRVGGRLVWDRAAVEAEAARRAAATRRRRTA